MGELRAYVLRLEALRAVLDGGPAQRDRALAILRPVLPPAPPGPLGPIFTRVPGTPVVRDDEPAPADLERLLGGEPVPAGRVRATWRLVEAVASALAVASTRVAVGRPEGLAPLDLAVPVDDDLVVGSWTLAEALTRTALRTWSDGRAVQLPPTSDAPDVVVFWSPGSTG